LSAFPGRKRDHPDDDNKTDVGVDAVLSADVDDAPMRQRQYTAPLHVPSAKAPHNLSLLGLLDGVNGNESDAL
jgi:hypothetical protein